MTLWLGLGVEAFFQLLGILNFDLVRFFDDIESTQCVLRFLMILYQSNVYSKLSRLNFIYLLNVRLVSRRTCLEPCQSACNCLWFVRNGVKRPPLDAVGRELTVDKLKRFGERNGCSWLGLVTTRW